MVSSHLVGDWCFSLVTFFGVPAGCTGVVVSNVKAMAPTVVHVGEEPGVPVAPGRSDVTFVDGLIGWLLDGCKCRSLGRWLWRNWCRS